MPEDRFPNAMRCPAAQNGGACNSAVFYDWGIQFMDKNPVASITGGNQERYRDWAQLSNVKICARCTTPYILEGGLLVDISSELSAEDVKAILARGQASLPHAKIRDP